MKRGESRSGNSDRAALALVLADVAQPNDVLFDTTTTSTTLQFLVGSVADKDCCESLFSNNDDDCLSVFQLAALMSRTREANF